MNLEDVSLSHPHDFFRLKSLPVQPGTCFVLMPFADEFTLVYETIVEALEGLMVCTRADDLRIGKLILARLLRGIATAELVIADLTGRNPNVFYELALAHTRTKNVLLLTQNIKDVPFDLRGYFCHTYKLDSKTHLEKLKTDVLASAKEIAANRMPRMLENAVLRTQRIVDAMNVLLRNPEDIKGLLVRIQASISSLGNKSKLNSENPEVRRYERLLEDERELLIQLVEKGASLRGILSPHKTFFDLSESMLERNLRIDRVISFLKREDDCANRCDFVVAPQSGVNLLFLGKEIMFEGHKTQVESGFGWTLVSTDLDFIEAREKIFDSLFESARDYMIEKMCDEGKQDLRLAVIESLEKAKMAKEQ